MAEVKLKFSHPKMDDLFVPVKPNEISWSYGLNTANYSTYGGEVIQIDDDPRAGHDWMGYLYFVRKT